MKIIIITCILFLSVACGIKYAANTTTNIHSDSDQFVYDTNYVANQFRNPVGNPPGKGYYDAQSFMKNTHLGEDWNGTGGGNSDLGDTIYACANGYVRFAEDVYGGWGNVVRVLHQLPRGNKYIQVESLYAHCDTIFVKKHTYVKIGTPIGTIGTAHDIYPAHLHFEIRHNVEMEIGGGYSPDTSGFLNPKMFIKEFNKGNL